MQITGLFIYPIKSMGGISLKKATVLPRGLQYDRRWMLVDENHRFISQRQHRELALLRCNIQGDQLVVTHSKKDLPPLAIPLQPGQKHSYIEVDIWNDRFNALHLDGDYSDWFEQVLGRKCKLVYMTERNEPERGTIRYYQNGEAVSFADSCPLLVVGEASVADFNKRLGKPVKAANFRPNILVSTTRPYEEESWKSFKLGEVSFKGIRTCGRCQIIGIDQDKATNDPAVLKTLASYRKEDNKVLFGWYASLNSDMGKNNIIRVGDEVELND